MDTYSAAVPALVAQRLTGLPEWENITRQGLLARRNGNSAGAHGFYRQALGVAQSLLNASAGHAFSADDRMAAFVVSHLNLADLHADADETAEVVGWLCAAHEALMAWLCDAHADVELQQAAFRHSRETHTALLAHLAEHGSHPAIVQALHAGCLPLTLQPARRTVLH